MRSRASRRSVSIWDSPGPRVPMPPTPRPAPRRSKCVHRPRMRAMLYSSWASSTCILPSAVWACWAKMSRITDVRSSTGRSSSASRLRCWRGVSSSSATTTFASACLSSDLSSDTLPEPRYVFGWTVSRFCVSSPTVATPAVRRSSLSSSRSGASSDAAMQKARCRARGSAFGAYRDSAVRPLRERSKTTHSRGPLTHNCTPAAAHPRRLAPPTGINVLTHASPRARPEASTAAPHRSHSPWASDPLESAPMPVTPAPGESELAERLAARTLELIDVPSESRDEAALATHVATVLREGGAVVEDLGDSCVLAYPAEMRPQVLLAGHLDTVPAQDNIP